MRAIEKFKPQIRRPTGPAVYGLELRVQKYDSYYHEFYRSFCFLALVIAVLIAPIIFTLVAVPVNSMVAVSAG